MKKFRNLFSEQHREKARFHPTVPYNVPETKPAAGTLSKKKDCTCEEVEPLDEMPGANMDTRAVHSHLKKQGWKLTRTSGSHDVFTHPKSTEHIPVPRHRKLKAPLVLGILRKSKVNEETEMKKLDEISMQAHKDYQRAARREVPGLASHAQSGEFKDIAQNILNKRIGGMERSTRLQMRKRMTKEETEIDEAKLAMPLKGHPYHQKSDAELKYIQKDAHEAAQAMKGHNPKAEGKYLDQHNDASTVLHYRSKGGQQLRKEEYEMNEETHPLGAHAAKLEKYAHESGGIDKEDMLTAAEHMKSNNHEALKNKIRSMDTDPRDKVLDYVHPHHWQKLGFKPTGSMQVAVHHHNKMHGIKEETEQLDEISKETKKSYIGKAVDDMTRRTLRIASTSPRASVQPEVSQRLVKAAQKNVQRKAGIMRAVSSLAKEEVELSEENKPTNPELWARAKSMAKSKFDVYPSAYANGWAAKWYKSKGGGWKSVNEEKDEREYDYEGEMVKSDLRSIIANANRLIDMLSDEENLPEWCQNKITLAEDYVSTVANYMTAEMNEEAMPYVAVHAKKGKHETHGKTSYEAAQNAAKHWKMKNTAGIDVYRADKTHSTQHVGEEVEHLDELSKSTLSSYASKATDSARTMPGYGTKDEGTKKSKRMSGIVSAVKKLSKEETEPPFTPDKPKNDVVVGKRGVGMAKASQLARQAMQKQKEKLSKVTMKQESLEESRKTEVVRELAKKKKEKFEADPVLSDTVVKSAMPQP
jgi:predicted RNA binding protein YcfA (HicA-like mRNA interferase family)